MREREKPKKCSSQLRDMGPATVEHFADAYRRSPPKFNRRSTNAAYTISPRGLIFTYRIRSIINCRNDFTIELANWRWEEERAKKKKTAFHNKNNNNNTIVYCNWPHVLYVVCNIHTDAQIMYTYKKKWTWEMIATELQILLAMKELWNRFTVDWWPIDTLTWPPCFVFLRF